MRTYAFALWHRTSVFKCFTQVNINLVLTTFITLTLIIFKDYFGVWRSAGDKPHNAALPHCPGLQRSFIKDDTAVDATVANFNSKLMEPSLPIMKNQAF